MLQIAFDIFDSNSDGKISELDVYKVMSKFNECPLADRFCDILYNDVCQISKKLNHH